VKDLNGLSVDDFLLAVRSVFDTKATAVRRPKGQVTSACTSRGSGRALRWNPAARAIQFARLDVEGTADASTCSNPRHRRSAHQQAVDFIGGIRGTDELVKLVDYRQGCGGVLDVSRPTVEQLMDIADACPIEQCRRMSTLDLSHKLLAERTFSVPLTF
jgi:hypothetical protein